MVEGYNGTGIPMLMNNNGLCTGVSWPEVHYNWVGVRLAAPTHAPGQADGYYPFTEEITAAWLADRIVRDPSSWTRRGALCR